MTSDVATTGSKTRDVDLARLSRVLEKSDDGIWTPKTKRQEAVSFPDDGHDACFRIEDASLWFAHRNACIAAALRRHGVQGPLLDVGGGNGAVSKALDEQGIATVLLEPGPEGAQNARRRGVRNVICATLQDAGFEDGAFGAAGAFDVVEHVADDAGLLREIHRVLRPGGTLCVTVPAYGWLWSAEDELAGHHRRYSRGRLEALLAGSGFRVDYASYFFAPFTLPVFLMRSVPHRVRARRSVEEVSDGAARQHIMSPLPRRVMTSVLAPEIRRIAAGRTIPFGTSILAVATKV
jgi:SAM-dependent methyltransferase